MDKYAAGTRASELTLVEIPKAPEAPPDAHAGTHPHPDAVAADTFVADALREFQAGRIDKPLWARALTQVNGDEKLAMPAYLRARATALRVAKRDERGDSKASRRALARSRREERLFRRREQSLAASAGGGIFAAANRRYLIWAGGAITGVVLVAIFAVMRAGSDAPPQSALATPSRLSPNSGGGVPTTGSAANTQAIEDFPRRMQALQAAGNWNVLVLYAVEWTRKQPENPVAWRELSAGYLKLRQFDDAFSAANKATQLAPTDAAVWRNLGQVNVATDDLVAATAAFERASTLNDQDIVSLVQLGTLNMRFGRLQPAKAAFAKALALRPDDVDALCGNASIARQEGRTKDAEAINLQAKGSCRNLSSNDITVTAPSRPANSVPVVLPRR